MNKYFLFLILFATHISAQTGIGGHLDYGNNNYKVPKIKKVAEIKPLIDDLLKAANQKNKKCFKAKGQIENQQIRSVSELNIVLAVYFAEADMKQIQTAPTSEHCESDVSKDLKKCFMTKSMKKKMRKAATHPGFIQYLIKKEKLENDDARKVYEKLKLLSES
jgi:hypothetical protein